MQSAQNYLNLLSGDERAELTLMRKHEFSLYGLNGEHYSHVDEKEDLLSMLLRVERYVVDSNVDWQVEAAKPENQNKAFIIPRTVTDEAWNIQAALFGPKVKVENKNLFLFGPEKTRNDPVFVIHRLETYKLILEDGGLAEESKPTEERHSDLRFIEQLQKRRDNVKIEQQAILVLLGVSDIGYLPARNELTEKIAQFSVVIERDVPLCLGNFGRGIHVARLCYARSLMEQRSMRTEFAKQGVNVMNDTFSLQNALFFGAGIMTKDANLRRMADYAGLPLIPEPDRNAHGWAVEV